MRYRKRRLASFDVETTHLEDGEKWKPILAVFIVEMSNGKPKTYVFDLEGRYGYRLDDAKTMLLSLLQRNYYVFAHNSEFDVYALLEEDVYRVFERFSINPTIFYYRDKGRVVDLMNIYKFSLKKVGELIGLEKIDTELAGYMPKNDSEWRELIKYCIRDTEIVYKAVDDIRRKYNTIPTTAPQLALTMYKKYFRERFKKPLPRLTSNYKREFLRLGYYGGRVEAFYIGKYDKKVYYYDINSLYPYVMRNNPYPLSELELGYYQDIEKIVLAEVVVDIDENIFYPPSPFKSEKLLFPDGTYKTYLSRAELFILEDYGFRYRILRTAYAKEWEYIFEGYIDALYNLRLEAKRKGDSLLDKQYKLMMNSLYGKFGEREKETYIVYDKEDRDIYFVNREREGRWRLDWALLTTAYGRAELYNRIMRLLKHSMSRDVLYCDTDSLVSSRSDIETSNELGGLKIEHSGYITIYREKMYRFETGDKTLFKAKGIRKNWEVIEKEGEFIALGEKLIRLREGFRRNIRPLTPISIEKHFEVFKTDKRLVYRVNDYTYPIVIR